MKGKKTPHRPERCRLCFYAGDGACILFGRNMSTNKRGEPWENWVCPKRKIICLRKEVP